MTDGGAVRGNRTGWLAWLLAINAGFVDAAGFVALLRLFTAHQSGNTAGLGVALGAGQWSETWRRGVAIGAFAVGLALATALVETGRRRGVRSVASTLAALEVSLLAVALAVGVSWGSAGRIQPGRTAPFVTVAAAMASAMGVQTASLRRVGRRRVRTTFVTGVISDLTESAVVWLFQRRTDRPGAGLRGTAVLGSLWLAYLAGGVAGGVAQRDWSFPALGIPIVVTALIAGWDRHSPYAPDLPAAQVGE